MVVLGGFFDYAGSCGLSLIFSSIFVGQWDGLQIEMIRKGVILWWWFNLKSLERWFERNRQFIPNIHNNFKFPPKKSRYFQTPSFSPKNTLISDKNRIKIYVPFPPFKFYQATTCWLNKIYSAWIIAVPLIIFL
jgi:hypothetical protein